MRKKIGFLLLSAFLSILVMSTTPTSPLSGVLGNIFSLFMFLLFIIYLYGSRKKDEILINKVSFIMLSLLSILFVSSTIYNTFNGTNSGIDVFEAVTIVFIMLSSIYLIPNYLELHTIMYVTSRLAALSVLLSIIPIIIGDVDLFWLNIITYGENIWLISSFGIDQTAPASIFVRRNLFARVAVYGVFSSLYEYTYNKSRCSLVLLLINFLGVFIASVRGPIIAILISLFVFAIHYNLIKYNVNIVVQRFSIVTPYLFGLTIYFLFISSPDTIPIVSNIDFSNRDVMWRSTLDAIMNNPILGLGARNVTDKIGLYGPFAGSPQSGYLRVGLTSGLFAFSTYIIFINYIIYFCSSKIEKLGDIVLFSAMIFMAVITLFESFNIFGFNIDSFIFCIYIGYILYRNAKNDL